MAKDQKFNFSFNESDQNKISKVNSGIFKLSNIKNEIILNIIQTISASVGIDINNNTRICIENRKIKANNNQNRTLEIHKDSFGFIDYKCDTITIYYDIGSNVIDKNLEIFSKKLKKYTLFCIPVFENVIKEEYDVNTGTVIFIPEGVYHKPQHYMTKDKSIDKMSNKNNRYVLNLFIEKK